MFKDPAGLKSPKKSPVRAEKTVTQPKISPRKVSMGTSARSTVMKVDANEGVTSGRFKQPVETANVQTDKSLMQDYLRKPMKSSEMITDPSEAVIITESM